MNKTSCPGFIYLLAPSHPFGSLTLRIHPIYPPNLHASAINLPRSSVREDTCLIGILDYANELPLLIMRMRPMGMRAAVRKEAVGWVSAGLLDGSQNTSHFELNTSHL